MRRMRSFCKDALKAVEGIGMAMTAVLLPGCLIAGLAFLGAEMDQLENEPATVINPVLVEFHPENRNDGFVMVRDDKTGILYAIQVESRKK